MPTLIKYSDDLEDALKRRYKGETTIKSVKELLKYKDIQAYKDLNEYFTKYRDNDKKYYDHFREEEKLIPEDYLALLQDDEKKTIKYKLIRDIQNKLEIDSSTRAVTQSDKDKIYQMLDIINCDDLQALKFKLPLQKLQERIQKSQKKIALQKLQQNNKSNKSFIKLRIESLMSFLSTIIKWCREICRKAVTTFTAIIPRSERKSTDEDQRSII
jgi:hypothetical protein